MRYSLFFSAVLAACVPASAYAHALPQQPGQLSPIVSRAPGPSSKGRWLNIWPLSLIPTDDGADHRPLKPNYDRQVVLRFNVSTVEHEAAFRRAADQMLLDIWDFGPSYTDIRIPKNRIRGFLDLLPEPMRTDHMVLIQDLARVVAATYPSRKDRIDFDATMRQGQTPVDTKNRGQGVNDLFRHKLDDLFFKDYQPMSVISTWMQYFESMFQFQNEGLVSLISIGKSYEGRDIPALRVGHDTQRHHKKTKARKTILITGGLHAREWISVSTVNYLADMFASKFGKDDVVDAMLKEYDLVFVPVLNPDGYEYTWNVDRLWRKSRQNTTMSYCHGYDLDHSFGYRWNAAEHQSDPCSESYGGNEPFQAVEALQLAKWAANETKHNVDFVAYIDLHSYSQQILWPYAYSCDVKVPNLENMQEVAMNIAKYMRLLGTGEYYSVGSACESAVASDVAVSQGPRKRRIEAAGGAAIDYFHHDLNARYSFQIKLRDTGSYGFLLPSDSIVPVGDEVFEAVRFLGDYMLGNNGIEMTPETRQGEQKVTPGGLSSGPSELRRRKRR
ncbi:putative Zinc carboxypeptidase [Seiridium unicorne]|uniref:Inactive metallocarboxypeptidase ECM14 n=1 Tax=Seiridium unicorne TaxID=138068 RepID=A0ABR2UEF0_9PEZI